MRMMVSDVSTVGKLYKLSHAFDTQENIILLSTLSSLPSAHISFHLSLKQMDYASVILGMFVGAFIVAILALIINLICKRPMSRNLSATVSFFVVEKLSLGCSPTWYGGYQ